MTWSIPFLLPNIKATIMSSNLQCSPSCSPTCSSFGNRQRANSLKTWSLVPNLSLVAPSVSSQSRICRQARDCVQLASNSNVYQGIFAQAPSVESQLETLKALNREYHTKALRYHRKMNTELIGSQNADIAHLMHLNSDYVLLQPKQGVPLLGAASKATSQMLQLASEYNESLPKAKGVELHGASSAPISALLQMNIEFCDQLPKQGVALIGAPL